MKSSPAVAPQRVDAIGAVDVVVALAAVDRRDDERGEVADSGEAVVASEPVERQVLGGSDVHRDGADVAVES